MLEKCQVFTPEKYSIQLLKIIGYNGKKILGKILLENSCGEGNILVQAVEKYIKTAQREKYSISDIKKDLENNFLGFEIDGDVRDKCIKRLNQKASDYGIFDVNWNILKEDYLMYDIQMKVDFIVGNPPYIMYQNIENNYRKLLRNRFRTCEVGKFDYCYPFIEKSLDDLNCENGKMSYLIPSSIFKNVFGKNVRNYIKSYLREVYDFKGINIFENALVSPSIIYLSKGKENRFINYYDVGQKEKHRILKANLNNDKWVFTTKARQFVEGEVLGDYCQISNSVATLLNKAYVIKEYLDEDLEFIKVDNNLIEKKILRKAASPKGKANGKNEFIIFPYHYHSGKLIRYNENDFALKFPKTYTYLKSKSEELSKRKSDKNSQWFEYGRSQALSNLDQKKLLISSVITNNVKLYELSQEEIPYSGFYIIPKNNSNLEFVKEVMESKEFYEYIREIGINANGSSLRFSVKDFMEFPLMILNS